MNVRVWGVGELTTRIKELLEVEIDRVWIRGEISGFKIHPASGHAYFNLKDDRAIIACVAWATTVRQITRALRPRDGLLVRCFGRVTVYGPRGAYQVVVEQLLDEGEGELQAAFLRLKTALEAEGLFDPSRKRPLPLFPRRIGIVTSPSGAALRDMLRTLERRWPLVEVVLRPAPVQGPGAAAELAEGVADLNRIAGGVDLILLGRGGGSLEDLWAFNEEVLARAVAVSRIPIVSAVGHETDFTICDFVADARAATPTHGAEMAVPDRDEILRRLSRSRRSLRSALDGATRTARLRLRRLETSRGLQRADDLLRRGRLDLDRLGDRLRDALAGRAQAGRERLERAARRLSRGDPSLRLAEARHRLRRAGPILARETSASIERLRGRCRVLEARLVALGPERVLARGYGIVSRTADGVIVRSSTQVQAGDRLRVRLHAGRLGCTVDTVEASQKEENR